MTNNPNFLLTRKNACLRLRMNSLLVYEQLLEQFVGLKELKKPSLSFMVLNISFFFFLVIECCTLPL